MNPRNLLFSVIFLTFMANSNGLFAGIIALTRPTETFDDPIQLGNETTLSKLNESHGFPISWPQNGESFLLFNLSQDETIDSYSAFKMMLPIDPNQFEGKSILELFKDQVERKSVSIALQLVQQTKVTWQIINPDYHAFIFPLFDSQGLSGYLVQGFGKFL